MSDKADFKTESIIKDKERHCTPIKGSIQEKDITFVDIYARNMGTPKCIKKILRDINREIDSNSIIWNFNTPLTSMDRSPRLEAVALNDTLDKMNLIDTYRTLHSKTAEYQVHMELSSG